LPIRFLRNRFLWRLRAPAGADETRRIERWLASARVFLAVSALVAVWIDPTEIRYSPWASGLFSFYIAQSVIILLLLRRRPRSTSSFRLLVHLADIFWPALILIFATPVSNPFFLFFVFVLAAAAYRWGMWETAGTAVVEVILLWIESLLLDLGLAQWLNVWFVHYHLPALNVDMTMFEPKHLFMRSSYLIVMGFLLGYLAEQQKQLRAEKSAVTRMLGNVRVDAGLTGTLQQILNEIAEMYSARRTLIASQETNTNHVFVAEISTGGELNWLESSPQDREIYLFDSWANAGFTQRGVAGKTARTHSIGLDRRGRRLRELSLDFLQPLGERHSFESVATVSFLFGREWWGRIFLLDAQLAGNAEEELRFLQELVKQLGPAVYNVYLLRRLRQRAGAVERARFARELHDGAVQSLIAVEMQVDVLRRQAESKPAIVSGELQRIQKLLREEVLKLRELMQQMKSLDVDSRKLLNFLSDTVERFQRETGIIAQFESDIVELDMAPYVCREVARIVQEALVNVRKHSDARQVQVAMGAGNGNWRITIQDDGCGFPFTGRYADTELEKLGKGPMVIRERVRLINGELTIESNAGRGARLEITVPQRREAALGVTGTNA
jgi:signal transduction histidine kinase